MATLQLNGKTLATQTSSAEPVLASTVDVTSSLAAAKFPAGHTINWVSYTEGDFSLSTLNQSGGSPLNKIIAVGGIVRSAIVLPGNSLFITMCGGSVRLIGTASWAAAGFYYTIDGSDPASVVHGGTVPSTLVLGGVNIPSAQTQNSYKGLGSVSFMYTNSTASNVTVKFRPCVQNSGANWAIFFTDSGALANKLTFTVAHIQG